MWSAAGQRVVRDPAFRPSEANAQAYARHAKGNSLYRNKGNGTFEETGAREQVEMGRWAWGSGGFDFDLDGVPEIFIASGMVTNGSATGTTDLDSFFWRQVVANSPATMTVVPEYENAWNAIGQMFRGEYSWRGGEPNVFYKREGDRYVDHSGVSGLDFADDSRSFAVTDFDGDGYPDLILKSRLGPQIRALQNDCATGKPAIVLRLRGTKSNRDAIGARVDVNGQVQFVNAGSGFLSQHSKQLHFGLKGRESAEVNITWPSGSTQVFRDLKPGFVYTLTEDSAVVTARQAFRTRALLSSAPVKPDNAPVFEETWLLEPVPTPEQRKGPGFIELNAADLAKEKDEVAAAWSLFHRYLFEYRAELALPLTVLIDDQSRARKVYAGLPSEATRHADLAQLARSRELALPFPGRYCMAPRRNYFKLGVAFYWAGYSGRALPYLEEELRQHPESWNVLFALGRIQLELGRAPEALRAFRRVETMKPGYAPAIVNIGMAELQRNDPSAAHKEFLRAMEADPKCAEAANELGLLAAQANQLDEARNWFHRAIEAVPGHAEAVNNLGVFYAQIRQYPDAVAAFRYGLQYNPASEPLHLNLARIFLITGQKEEARMVLTELLERRPDSTAGQKQLNELEAR